MKSRFREFFTEFEEDKFEVDFADAIQTARLNMLSFSIEGMKSVLHSQQDWADFISEISIFYEEKLEYIPNGASILSYFWIDEMAGLMCSSIFSGSDTTNLPFGGKIQLTTSLQDFSNLVFKCSYTGLIPHKDFEQNENALEKDEIDFSSPLVVLVKILNQ